MIRTALAFFLFFAAAVWSVGAGIRGRVATADGRGVSGILISNGRETTRTDADGRYRLPKNAKSRFVTLSEAPGWRVDSHYLRLGGADDGCDFTVREVAPEREFTFGQIADVETWQPGGWIAALRRYAEAEKPAFIINTGDICYRKGLDFNIANVNAATIGVPFHYSIGNHDLLAGDYGEEYYESLYGPVMYSFERGRVLFLVTPMLRGDFKPSYTAADVAVWMKNTLDAFAPGQPVVIFNHDASLCNDELVVAAGDAAALDLKKYNIKGFFHGHLHTNDYRRRGGSLPTYCVAPPRMGGADSSPAAMRTVAVDAEGNLSVSLRWMSCEKQLFITAPAEDRVTPTPDGRLAVLVAAYDATNHVTRVAAKLVAPDGTAEAIELAPLADWSHAGSAEPPIRPGTYRVEATAELYNGETVAAVSTFDWPCPAAAAARTGEDWPQLLANPERSGRAMTGVAGRLTPRWATALDANIFLGSPIVAGGRVFVATIDDSRGEKGGVYALDACDGRVLWCFRTGASVRNSIAYLDGRILAADVRNRIYALDAADGRLLWRAESVDDRVPGNSAGVLVADGLVFAGHEGGLRALRAGDGLEVWRQQVKTIPGHRPDAGTVAAYTRAGEALIVPGNWIHLRALELATGKLRWVNPEHRYFQSSGSVRDGRLYLGANRFLALDAAAGTVERAGKRDETLLFKTASTPLVLPELILAGTVRGGLAALDRVTLEPRWRTPFVGKSLILTPPYCGAEPTVESSPVAVGGRVWFGASDGGFYGVDPATGELKQSFFFGAPVLATAAVSGNMVFTADFGGRVYGFIAE